MRRALLAAAALVLLPYARTAVYDFPPSVPFSGQALFNPYAQTTGRWQRANLHAHGRPWWGLTTGRQHAGEVVAAYRRIGYSVAGISDYQHVAAQHGIDTIPLYEHGYNLGKRHQLGVGARKVVWFDFPLGQSLGQQQLIINLVGRDSELVALAHPEGRDAYSEQDMRRLTGVHLMEVVNGPFVAERSWDAALSAGRPVWALGNDDNHDLHERRRFGVAWNMIDADSAAPGDVVGALRQGRHYAVLRTDEIPTAGETTLESVTLTGSTLNVTAAGEPSTLIFIGQDGSVRKTVRHALRADYTLGADDTYVRTVIKSPRTVMYLNPVFRYDGRGLPAPAAKLATAATWAMRSSVVLAAAALLWLLGRRQQAVAL